MTGRDFWLRLEIEEVSRADYMEYYEKDTDEAIKLLLVLLQLQLLTSKK